MHCQVHSSRVSGARNVTAYNYSLKIDYANGTSNLEDRSSELAVDPTYEGFFLRAGSTRDGRIRKCPTKQRKCEDGMMTTAHIFRSPWKSYFFQRESKLPVNQLNVGYLGLVRI